MSRLAIVLEHYGVDLRPDRINQLVLCPFGHEANASCSVNLDKGLYNCFSCGRAGDELTLIQQKEDCDYAASVRRLIEIAGTGDESVRAGRRGGKGVPGRSGYKPKYRRVISAGIRSQSG